MLRVFLPIALVLVIGSCVHHQSKTPPQTAPSIVDLTGASDSELRKHLGETITIRGRFSLRGKLGPFINFRSGPIYIEPSNPITSDNTYDNMEGKQVKVTGALRFAKFPPSNTNALPEARPPDHFYFESETVKIELVSK
ncbi:MAG: hypothetical protein ABR555_02295 [Pyrinomonadaceae bacterium]